MLIIILTKKNKNSHCTHGEIHKYRTHIIYINYEHKGGPLV